MDKVFSKDECFSHVKSVNDAMYVLSGKWKIPVLASICYNKKRRFSEILKDLEGISNKMLSKELKELEINKLVTREIISTRPITIEYKLTDHGKKLTNVISLLSSWGVEHRNLIIKD
ncbi:helix-turn-helix transcriptional regulator [Empedobacter falsenii]|uniref:Helix-turn-helix transcriptional regulator n=1 Tax=Empedobacter falsenii TaxID=343874 RepID=A0A7H9DX29_9FLAO|nr:MULTISPECIES: helix-turn-helix domain-containing protein [Empedobacter]HCC94098.1 transcriptional regulator [Flavobacteriaceae bacterium]MDH2205454.1 helix-turn-helix transcriptional regulator [Empedobacter sp. GD03644]MDM1061004.1 helix-turn-helix transcriptional regulator [Empedobacter falsenii]MDM1546301.1 helix-turn-helix transcriptional regulator [Empedobacter falsenii]MDM1550260.1 helix-turn-helix transcriptional regulator [Empedobacter falsenii]